MNFSIIRYVLGWVLNFEAVFLLLPCLIALLYKEENGYAFLLTAGICGLIGFAATRRPPANKVFYAREGFVTVALSWIILSIFGAVPFVINGDIPSYTDALFEVISGFTTTGASILSDVEVLARCSLFWRSFTHWIGGMGVLVFILAVLPLAGGYNMHLMRAESPGPQVGKLVPRIRTTAKLLYGIYIAITFAEIIFLLISGMPAFDAITLSLGTAGTGGFGILNSSIGSYTMLQQGIIAVFMILFGINFNVYYLLLAKKPMQALKCEELKYYLLIVFGSVLLITLNIRELFSTVGEAFHQALFQVGSIITTTGYATTDFNLWPETSKYILVILMFVGACAGSTGGGIKVSRIIILLKTVKKEMASLIHPRSVKKLKFEGRTVDHDVLRSINVFIMAYAAIFGLSLLLISFDNFDFTTNATAVTATLNNIGPGLNMVGPTGNFSEFSVFSKAVLMFNMLAGRLELFPMLLLLTPGTWRNN